MKDKQQYSQARGYNLGIALELGLPAACLFNQLLFWNDRSKDDWFFKSYDELIDELPISKRTVIRAREQLEAAEYVETQVRKANGVPTLHWRITRFAIFDSAKLATSDSAKLATSINNKEHNKEKDMSGLDATDVSHFTMQVYQLYLKYFIIPNLKVVEVDTHGEKLTPGMIQMQTIEKAMKRYKLTPKRKEAVKRRLEDAGLDMLKAAVVGYGKSEWHTGTNNRNWVAGLDDFICRSYEKVEEGARLYENSKKSSDDAWSKL